MRCSRCNFENIPGEVRCIRCGSILISEGPTDIHPPRMSGWKKPLRTTARWFRLRRGIPEKRKPSKPSIFLDAFASDSAIGLMLSIIPGLAHVIKGRFREIRLHFFLWLICILTGLFFYGSFPGFILIGMAVGFHVWIALQYGLIYELSLFREKFIAGLLVALLILLCYHGVSRLATAVCGIGGGFSSLEVPAQRVETGDYLLTRNIDDKNEIIRGSLVLFQPVRMRNNSAITSSRIIIGQVVALPGESVEVKKDHFVVDGEQLDVSKIPVPGWLQNRNVKIYVNPASYFVSSEYNIHIAGNINITNDNIRQVCIIKAGDIRARAFMRWLPILRRGFLRQE